MSETKGANVPHLTLDDSVGVLVSAGQAYQAGAISLAELTERRALMTAAIMAWAARVHAPQVPR